ncbi:MAG: shikimate dehydrogenase [Acidobacteria bacterium]|nr:shikimate dehydrogenase [Acidobacteriota bacterium]MBI3664023.1 shikimate dehydrogenase [Acidobacteriota bacterium]
MSKPLFGKDRICAVVAAPTAREMKACFRKAARITKTVELRLDWLKNEDEEDDFLLWPTDERPRATVITTCRRRAAGGRYSQDIFHQTIELYSSTLTGASWCDVELETLEFLGAPYWNQHYLHCVQILASFHNFKATPKEIWPIFQRVRRFAPEAIKIATQCNSIADSLRVLALAKGKRNVIAVPMGEIGLPARVLALREGSALAYAAAGEKTAPGQLTLDEMKNLYRADKLNRKTRVYGVIGDPVSHSLSPLMHNLAFQQKKINAVYLPFLVRDLKDFLGAIKPLGIAGFSVTLPHKEEILRHLDDCDPLAAAIGAVNTVVVRGEGKLYGCNTDYVGVLRALESALADLRGSRVLLFGAGGVARAVAFALAQAGAIVCVSARRMSQAEKLARAVQGEAVSHTRIRKEFFDAIVNATPVGMHPRANEAPLAANELNCRLVFDTIYRPMKTKLLKLAERRGIETVSGVEMFIAQGTAQFDIWTGRRAPVALMRKAVLNALREEERK